MGTRREHAQQRRAELLDAALAVFADKGFAGASVKDIAIAAGVTAGLLYHYFPGKEALLVAVLTERGFLPELRGLLDAGGQRPAREVLIELAVSFDRLLTERADLVRLFVGGAATDVRIRERLTAVVTEGQHLLGNYLAARTVAGELRSHDTEVAAQLLLSTIVLGQVLDRKPDLGILVDLMLHGLYASSTQRSPSTKD